MRPGCLDACAWKRGPCGCEWSWTNGDSEMGISGDPWPAPAKLNLFLHILGRRPDGYHELQTAFQLIDLCDEISFDARQDGQIMRAEGPFEVPPFDDLTVQAARRLQKEQRGGRPLGVGI